MEPCRLGSEQKACEGVALLSTVLSQGALRSKDGGARSSVHFDATYYLAQLAGFSPRDAHLIAAYDQAVDTGQYVHRGQDGQMLADPATCGSTTPDPACTLNTLVVGGLDRNNFVSGGVFFHFMAPLAGVKDVNGLAPDIDDAASETFLHSLRRWAYGLGPLCVGGFTNPSASGDLASGSSCFNDTKRSLPQLMGRMPAASELGYLGYADWLSPLGEQTVVTDPVSGKDTEASELGKYFAPEELPLVRLGIYMHALQDRISHHRCLDVTRVEGPRSADAGSIVMNPIVGQLYLLYQSPSSQALQQVATGAQLTADPDFFYSFDTDECDQLTHANRHTWEVGASQSSLQPRDQTTRAALLATLRELRAFRRQQGLTTNQPADATVDQALMDDLILQLEVEAPAARLAALRDLALRRGLLPPAGFAGLTYQDWDARAGVHEIAARTIVEATTRRRIGAVGPGVIFALVLIWFLRGVRRRNIH